MTKSYLNSSFFVLHHSLFIKKRAASLRGPPCTGTPISGRRGREPPRLVSLALGNPFGRRPLRTRRIRREQKSNVRIAHYENSLREFYRPTGWRSSQQTGRRGRRPLPWGTFGREPPKLASSLRGTPLDVAPYRGEPLWTSPPTVGNPFGRAPYNG